MAEQPAVGRTASRKARFPAGLFGIVLLVGGAIWLYSIISKISYPHDRAIVEWQAAKLAESVIRARPETPQSWGAGLYLSNAVLASAASTLDGFQITSTNDDVVFTIERVRISTRASLTDAEFTVQAFSKTRGATARFRVEGVLSFAGIEQKDEDTALLKLGVVPVEIVPELRWLGFDFKGNAFTSSLISGGLLASVVEAGAAIVIPFQNDISRDYKDPIKGTLPINEELGSKLDYEVTIPEIKLSARMMSVVPLFLKGGVWILASETETPGIAMAISPADRSRDTLVREANEIRADVEKISSPPGEAAIWVGADLMTSAINRIANLPPEQRVVRGRSTEISGRIAQIEKDAGVLGKVGAYAQFNGNDAVKGHATLDLAPRWVPGVGFQLGVALGAHVEAKAEVHVKPPMAPGVGVPVTLIGDAGVKITAEAAFSVATIEGSKVLFARLGGNCGALMLALTADGSSKTTLGWISVPAIGAIWRQGIDLSPVPPIALIDDLPHVVDGRAKDGSPLKVKQAGREFLIEPTRRYLEARVVPSDPKAEPRGWMLQAAITIGLTDNPVQVEASRKVLRATVKKMRGQRICKGEGTLGITLDGLNIGSVEQIAKYLKDVGHFSEEVTKAFLEETDPNSQKEWIINPTAKFDETKKKAEAAARDLDVLRRGTETAIQQGGEVIGNTIGAVGGAIGGVIGGAIGGSVGNAVSRPFKKPKL